MTKIELLERLEAIANSSTVRGTRAGQSLLILIEDINTDGVLDVQQPPSDDVQRMHRALITAGLTRADLRGATIADLIALHESLP